MSEISIPSALLAFAFLSVISPSATAHSLAENPSPAPPPHEKQATGVAKNLKVFGTLD